MLREEILRAEGHPASQPKKQDTKREELVSSLLRDAEKAGHKAKDNTPSTKEPVPVK